LPEEQIAKLMASQGHPWLEASAVKEEDYFCKKVDP
jgi:hypothetical protein